MSQEIDNTPQISNEDTSIKKTGKAHTTLAVVPLRNIVVFPHMVVPLFVGRKKSIEALNSLKDKENEILLVSQKDPAQEVVTSKDLYRYGTLGRVLQILPLPGGNVKALVEGIERVKITRFSEKGEYIAAGYEKIGLPVYDQARAASLAAAVVRKFEELSQRNRKLAPEVSGGIAQIKDPNRLADTIAAHLNLRIPDRQSLLEETDILKRLENIYSFIEGELDLVEVDNRIQSEVKKQMEKSQREYYLNEQIKAIQKELYGDEGGDDLREIEEKIKTLKLPKEVKEKAESELRKLRAASPMSGEHGIIRNYLDWIVSLPWGKSSKLSKSLSRAEDILNKHHYGLTKVKDRILDYLAVQSRSQKVKGPILCFVGPPGVGKTSLAKSIAESTGRKFIRISLGGVHDEAEIRGHRRTYLGALPGRIIQAMKKVGTNNPLILLDEIDKTGADWRGDPSSALLEVLDPEQNNAFNDHYLELDYDLSNVMFVATANSLDMPQPLRDRMEIIQLEGYTEEEKLEIATKHLVSKQEKANQLKSKEWLVGRDTLESIIRYYTREAGVRTLERQIGQIARKIVRELFKTKASKIEVTPENLEKYLGVRKYKHGLSEERDEVGLVTGLAWTQVGGETLSIEAIGIPGKGVVTSTGKLGEVMQESLQAAFSYVRSRAEYLGIDLERLKELDIHVHLPEGAVPKDGPSAGIGLALAFTSVLTGIPVRKDTAMTGEITLRGRVLEIGGLKEKLLAALRAGIKRVIIPMENKKDIQDLPESVKNGLEILPVSTMDEVLSLALVNPKAFPAQRVELGFFHPISRPESEIIALK